MQPLQNESKFVSMYYVLKNFNVFRMKTVEAECGKYASQRFEKHLDSIEGFPEKRLHLLNGAFLQSFMERRRTLYSKYIFEKSNVFQNCVGSIDETVIGVFGPGSTTNS